MRVEPRATYRLQLSADCTLHDAAALVPYLDALGISHVYTSPLSQARPGSTHGYDVVDHRHVAAELGGEAGFTALTDALAARGMGLVVDLVPNHMAVGPANRWWWDVLRSGRASEHAAAFDIDWDPPERRLADRILLPVLGDHYARVLEAGELRLVREGDELQVAYHEHRFPLDPASLDGSLDGSSGAGAFADDELAAWSRDPDRLDALLERQHYRLAHWRTSAEDLDYRRFFDVDELVGLRVEEPAVFDAVHERALAWVAEGRVDGVRIDHVDGLRDPEGYLRRLRARLPDAWVLVEKILEPAADGAGAEELRPTWPVDGTTGYDVAARIDAVLLDPAGAAGLATLHETFTGDPTDLDEVVAQAKAEVLDQVLAAELHRLTETFVRVGEDHRRLRDVTRRQLHDALHAVLVGFPVYRTYVDEQRGASPEDEAVVQHAVATAKARHPDVDPELLDVLRDLLLARAPFDDAKDSGAADLRARFQQVSGPVMAKAVEDTTFYRFTRLLSVNEVGATPACTGLPLDAFHASMARLQATWPRTMTTLTTHDSKRSEDVRARLHLLAEQPAVWMATVARWHERTATYRSALVDPAVELYLYQTLVGAHPLSRERTHTHVEKAMREAKRHTSWIDPDDEYERAVHALVDGVFDDAELLADLDAFVAPLVAPGRVNALAQKLVQLTVPGVPDVYQGQELWEPRLVDPDNRRPVDFDARRQLLDGLARSIDGGVDARLDDPADPGTAKLHVVRTALAARRDAAGAFGRSAGYAPITAAGPQAHRVLAYAREGDGEAIVVVVPRFPLGLAADPRGWDGTTLALPAGDWWDLLGGGPDRRGELTAASLFDRFPVALLRRR